MTGPLVDSPLVDGPLVGCVLVAGGSGLRLGQDRPKALVEVGGATLLEHAVAGLAAPDPRDGRATVAHLVVVAPAAELGRCTDLARSVWTASGREGEPRVVVGGPDRQASVRAGLVALDPACDVVLVHDAARAFAPPSLVAAVADAVRGGEQAVVPGLPVTDTVKELAPLDLGGLRPGASRAVARTLDRASLVAVQTPQGFAAGLLRRVHHLVPDEPDAPDAPHRPPPRTGVGAGDDAGLVEAAGGTVGVVPGSAEAFKVTVPFDLVVAEALLAARRAPAGPGPGPGRLPD